MGITENPQVQQAIADVVAVAASLIGTVVLAVVTWLGVHAKRWLVAQTNDDRFAAALGKIEDVVRGLVEEAEQTLVAEAKRAAADGKLTRELAVDIRNEVVRRARDHFGAEGMDDLRDALGHAGDAGLSIVERMIRTRIEAEVANLKRRQ